jgi:hypothetical protein
MAKAERGVDLKKLARVGAAARLAELQREIDALKRAFPGLRIQSVDVVEAPEPAAVEAARVARKVARRGRRKPMGAAERKAVSERMKKYWAERRKQKE